MRTAHHHPLVALMAGLTLVVAGGTALHDRDVTAAPGDIDATFVPTSPCRLFDYRPAPHTVGTRDAPLGSGETAVQQVTGHVGACTVPSAATGVAMNVTITGPTAASFLTVFPSDVTRPTASSLNWVAGQASTPNAVDVRLSATGAIRLYNAFGEVYVLADVVGYYTTASLVDLDHDVASLQQQVATLEQQIAGLQADLAEREVVDLELAANEIEVPSGRSISGVFGWDHSVVATGEDIAFLVPLPAHISASTTVRFAPNPVVVGADTACTGTPSAPTAPAGELCAYVQAIGGVGTVQAVSATPLPQDGFYVTMLSTGAPGADAFLYLTWAYTAP